MTGRKNILAIIGSASSNTTNLKLIEKIASLTEHEFVFTIFKNLKMLPHFDPELSIDQPPKLIVEFRSIIEKSDGIIICTPEYVFSIPSGLKNAIEWCVSTTVFTNRPVGLITASASGEKAHKELKLIMKTLEANFTDETTLLIQGVKGKVGMDGKILDSNTERDLKKFVESFIGVL